MQPLYIDRHGIPVYSLPPKDNQPRGIAAGNGVLFSPQERDRARRMVGRAVTSGHLDKPDACEMCMRRLPLTAHHNTYGHPLRVAWLCRECHDLVDKP